VLGVTRVPKAAALLSFAAVGLASHSARADATGWVDVGGGALGWKTGDEEAVLEGNDDINLSAILPIDVGVGTGPIAGPFIIGGMFRVQPVIGEGVDLALFVRGTHVGFMSSPFGVAIDLGGYQRTWGDTSTGFIGQAVLGLPLGFEVGALGSYGTESTWGVGGFAALDFVRLTVHRTHMLEWWTNPNPSEAGRVAAGEEKAP
jgi:hypothetical protein